MGRFRARLLSVAIVLGVMAAAAYASLVLTPALTAHSNPYITTSNPGRVIFSIRNTNPTPITINGFSQLMMIGTTDCMNINAPVRLDGQTTAATLAPGEQMQYIATTTNGWPNPGQFSCSWSVLTDDPNGPYTIEALFQVGSAGPGVNLDAQPYVMDFGSQTITGGGEVQKVMISNYVAARGVVLTIVGDAGGKDITFFDAGCMGTTTCAVSLPTGPNYSLVNVRCLPVETNDVNAQILVTSGGSGQVASIDVHCNASGNDILIADNPIQISAAVNTVGMQTTTISSPNATTALGSAYISNADATFKITNCPTGPSQSCTYGAQPLPHQMTVECLTATAQKIGTLNVFSTTGGSASSQITCTGTGTPPILEVGPLPTWGGVMVGDFLDQTIDLSNTGGSQLSGLVIDFPFSNSQHWRALDCATSPGCSIPAGGTLPVTIRFQPLSIGDKPVMMQLVSNASNSPVLEPLTGTGLGGIMSVTNPPGPGYILDLGSIPRGTAYSRTITLANLGNFTYTAMHTGTSSPYTVTPATLAVGLSQPEQFTVECQSPTATATNNEQHLIISSNAISGSPVDVTLRCKIEDTLVQVTPTVFDFGEVRVGTGVRTITVTVTNPAGAAVAAHITKLSLRTAIAALSLNPAMTDITLQPGDATTATLELSDAMDTTIANEYLDIDVDNANLSFPVTGKVVTPHSRVAPQQLELGTACVSTSVSGTVMLINDGTATLAVDPPQMDGNFVASSPNTPSLLSPMMSLTATVSPATSAMGLVEGTLTWHEDSEYTHRIPVTLEYVSTGTALSPKGLDFGIVEAGFVSDAQKITLQNCDPTTARIKVEALRTKQGALAAWDIEPRIGYTKDLRGLEVQAIEVVFKPPARGMYEADLEVTTPAGAQKIHLVGEATGRDFDNTSFYACGCSGAGAPARGWPVLVAIALIFRRRRVSSSAR